MRFVGTVDNSSINFAPSKSGNGQIEREKSTVAKLIVEILKRDIEPEADKCWTACVPALAAGDAGDNPRGSQLEVMEDGTPLGRTFPA